MGELCASQQGGVPARLETHLEGESVDVGLVRGPLDDLGLLEGGPPLRERGELDQVPDVGQGLYDNAYKAE
jgi:hypothetical protein